MHLTGKLVGYIVKARGNLETQLPAGDPQCSEKNMIKRMKANTNIGQIDGRPNCRIYTRSFVGLVCCFVFLAFSFIEVQAKNVWPQVVLSKDGTPISYEVYGAGEPTLVFVHGWSCDARYWGEQVPYFSKNHRIVILDLAGAKRRAIMTHL